MCHTKTPLISLQMEQTWFRPAFMRQRILTLIRDALSSGSLSKYHRIYNRRTLRISSHLFATNTHFPTPTSQQRWEIRFYVFTRYFTPEMGAILLVNEALSVKAVIVAIEGDRR